MNVVTFAMKDATNGKGMMLTFFWITDMSPSASTTVSITVLFPGDRNWWVSFWVVKFPVPSPKFHW